MKTKTTLYFLIILNSLTLFSCSQESDIAVLNKRINDLEKVIEQHQESKVSSYLAKDFVTNNSLNKAQFLLFIRYQLKQNKNISVILVDKEIAKNNNLFDVTFRVLLVGSNHLLPERGKMYSVASRWKKEGGIWVMSRIRWDKFNANE